MRRSIRLAAAAAASMLVLGGLGATAAPVTLDDVELENRGATWDVQNDYFYGSGGPCFAQEGFIPVEDGAYDNGIFDGSDAFDTGLLLLVNGKTFVDKDGEGAKKGQQLTVGPTKISGLKVTRVERALIKTPTLRSLIGFKNPTGHAIKAKVLWDSAMGSDDDESTRASSSGNHKFTPADLWAVTSDAAGTDPVSDPAVTFVVAGPGHPAKTPAAIPNAPETDDDDTVGPNTDAGGCVTVRYSFKVPARSTSYLLFFTQMHGSNEAAAKKAAKFSDVKPGSPFFAGLSPKVRRNILNFDLT